VKKAMHAPESVGWAECKGPVFLGGDGGPESEGDLSADPIQKVLPQVIEATNRVLVSNGDYDMIIITNGTLMSVSTPSSRGNALTDTHPQIQNMTWNGALGFVAAPSTPINITLPDLEYQAIFVENEADGWDGPQGVMGLQHYERGLMWAETYMSGHMQPQFQPRVTYRHLEWVLGRVDSL
jgi:carboxypeptidase D